jgi:type IV pilus assembly protein PilC
MITYAYKARDMNGKVISGTQEALDEDSAMSALMGRGLLVLQLEKRRQTTRPKQYVVKTTDLVMFTRQLATMVGAGLPLIQCLEALHDTADPKRQASLRFVISDLMSRVSGGDTFHESLRKHPRVFNQLYTSMVKAGEAAGLLDTILDRLAGFLEASARLAKKVKSALVYPIAVLCIAFGITAFLIIKVVPVFADIYAEFNSALPGPTQMLVNLSNFLQQYWWVAILMMVGAFFAIKLTLNTPTGRRIWDKYKLKLPIFGPLIYKIAMTRFARTFSQLIRSGVPILESIDIVGDTSGNVIISESMAGMRKRIEDGDPLSAAMAKDKIFPPMLVRMVAAGEETGAIEEMLEKISDFWDEEIEATLDALTSLMEPIMICVIGGIVGGIVVCMFLPIFKLHEIVS